MFRILPITFLFTLINVVHAVSIPVIAAYDFENERLNKWGNQYVVGWGINEAHGYLLNDAEILPPLEGKYGKALLIDGHLEYFGEHPPNILGAGISIVAWVKMPPQPRKSALHLSLRGLGLNSATGTRALSLNSSGILKFTGFYAVAPPMLGAALISKESDIQDIIDNEWHHIAYTYHSRTHQMFVDGEIVFQEKSGITNIDGSLTSVSIGNIRGDPIRGTLIDDAGIFAIGLQPYQIRQIYNNKLSNFINAMPVDPQEKVATTWASLKRR